MCLADQFEAMKTLIDNNKSIEEVAVAFGMSPLTVQRWLKLANVSPRLFALFRDDEITIEHMLALAQTDDHELQEQVWDSLPSHSRQPFRIRELLTKGEINMKTDPVARYVGAAAYEKAGGTIRRDLFSDNDSGFMTDSALLMTLAQAKLAKAAKQVEKEGFAWVEPRIRLDYSERNTYGHIRTVRLTPTPEQQAALDAIDAEEKTLDAERDAADDDADEDAFEQRSDDLEQRRDEIESALAAPHPDDKAVAGAIVTIGHGGKIEIIRNLVRPEDKRMLARAGGGSAEDGKEKPTHSERLTRQLTAQRTAALQAALITMPDIALIALTSRLASQVFSHYGRGEQIVKVNLITAHLRGADDSIEESRAWKELQAKHEEWKQRIPDDDEQSMFTWLLTQPQVVVLDLLAYCTARSLDSVQSREDSHSGFNEMAKAIDLNMANWWMPTKTTYLDHVKKNRIVEVVTEAVSAEAAEPLGSMKKDAMIDAAERALAGTGWLPNILKVS
jgi:ParB family chromosome partitioning protein